MLDVLGWLLFIMIIGGLLVVGGLLLRGHLKSGLGANPFSKPLFQQKPDKRLDVIEQTNLDGRRKLVLVRRDQVEHLIMTGGPVDVVLETGIDTRQELRASAQASRASTLGSDGVPSSLRPARHLNRAANER
ncbi:MAG: hypothetical protein AAFR55_08175 [Pseudomonadota bacterium]